MNRVVKFFWERYTVAGRRVKAGRFLDNLMAKDEPGWGWAETNAYRLFQYVCLQGAAKIPLGKVSLRVIQKATKKYRLTFLFVDDHIWIGNDMVFILRKMRQANQSRRAV